MRSSIVSCPARISSCARRECTETAHSCNGFGEWSTALRQPHPRLTPPPPRSYTYPDSSRSAPHHPSAAPPAPATPCPSHAQTTTPSSPAPTATTVPSTVIDISPDWPRHTLRDPDALTWHQFCLLGADTALALNAVVPSKNAHPSAGDSPRQHPRLQHLQGDLPESSREVRSTIRA
jgi:hypothetical protein